jgi:polyphenol oxidase
MADDQSLQFLKCAGFSNPAVRTVLTTRFVSDRSIAIEETPNSPSSFNLATHVGDNPDLVAKNRALLRKFLPSDPLWLNQVHGVGVADDLTTAVLANSASISHVPTADAAITLKPKRVLAILTADCLPVVFASVPNAQIPFEQQVHGVACAHAGWRGLLNGVLEATVNALRTQLAPGTPIEAGFGAAIGPKSFEVGAEVFQAFCEQAQNPEQLKKIQAAFTPKQKTVRLDQSTLSRVPQKWFADLYQLAQIRLENAGVKVLTPAHWCTYQDEHLFFSHRRDTVKQQQRETLNQFPENIVLSHPTQINAPNSIRAGRQATLVWLDR